MEMTTEEDKRFSWDDVYDLLGGVVLALLVIIRRMNDIPAWLYMTIGLLVIATGIAELRHYLRKKKQGKKPFGAIFFSFLFALWGVGYIIKALALIL